jgi:amidase
MQINASKLAPAIAAGELSAKEATEFFIARIEKHNPSLNAVIAQRFDEARVEADKADERRQAGTPLGALHGVPMTIKDAFEVDGMTCQVGVPDYAETVSRKDSVVVDRLKAAGAIILGKTNTPFMCADWQSFNELTGTSNNPYNLDHTPGGSSGGSAAALAASLTALEFGSDIGGSIRVPSHFCGLFGHKPTHGIIPTLGHVPPAHGTLSAGDLNVVGPMGRCVDDIELALDLTYGLMAPASQGAQLALQGPRKSSPEGLRVGVWIDDPYCPIDDEMAANIEAAAKTLEKLGASVVTTQPNFDLAHHTEAFAILLSSYMGADFPEQVHQNMQLIVDAADPNDKSLALLQARGARLLHKDWLYWNEIRHHMAQKWQALFQEVDVLLCPVTPTPAMPHTQDADFANRPFSVNGKQRKYMENLVWPGVATLCGLPATIAPIAPHSSGLPMGVQIIGPAFEDKTPMAVARMLEQNGHHFVAPKGYDV